MDTHLRTAPADLIQMTWVRAGRMYSREWYDTPQSQASIRATRIGLMCSGARNVTVGRVTQGSTYTQHGEE